MNEGNLDMEKFLGNYLSDTYFQSRIGSLIKTEMIVAPDCICSSHLTHNEDFTCFSKKMLSSL